LGHAVTQRRRSYARKTATTWRRPRQRDDLQPGPNVHPRAPYIVTESDAFIIIW